MSNNDIYKVKKRALWKLLFYHDVTRSTFFNNVEEGKNWNDYKGGKYSILYQLNDNYKIRGKYEFLLEYPELSVSNHWRQSVNPLTKECDGVNNATGYEEVDIQVRDNGWGGLYKHRNCATLIGSYDGRWHYAIGVVNKQFFPRFPGPYYDQSIVYLWIKIPYSISYGNSNHDQKVILYSLMHIILITDKMTLSY